MAGISMMQKLLDNALTVKFAKSLKHSDLPEGWADNPEIVQLAKDAYREMGTESPWFKARFGESKVVDDSGEPLRVYHGSAVDDIEVFRPSKTGNLGPAIYATPDKKAAEEFANTHGGAKVYELFVDSKNPLKIANSLEAPEEFWGRLAGKTEADAISDLYRQGYDGAWAIGEGKSRWGNTAPEIAVYSPYQVKSTSNRGTFNPADPNIYKGIPWAIGAGAGALALAPEDAEAASFAGLKQAGDGLLDYMMKHRPEVPDEDELLSQGLHDLEELFPGIYKDGHKRYRTSGDAVTSEAMDAINAVRGNPDAEVDIFRAVPQGVRDFNVGDWVTTSKSYAHKHGGHALNDKYDIITSKAKASDLYNPGDSIAEMGYWGLPMAGKVTRGLLPAVGAGATAAALAPSYAEAAIPGEQYVFPADKRGTVLYEPGLESPLVDPADLLTAPIGVPTAALKAASVAAEPFISYGMDKAINGLLGLLDDEED